MHDDIKAFTMQGLINDVRVDQTKDRLIHSLTGQMHDDGYIQVYDIDPQFTLKYIENKRLFEFSLTIYGVKGDNKLWAGITEGKTIPKSTPKNKFH